jgi:hypothetical protein
VYLANDLLVNAGGGCLIFTTGINMTFDGRDHNISWTLPQTDTDFASALTCMLSIHFIYKIKLITKQMREVILSQSQTLCLSILVILFT